MGRDAKAAGAAGRRNRVGEVVLALCFATGLGTAAALPLAALVGAPRVVVVAPGKAPPSAFRGPAEPPGGTPLALATPGEVR